MHMQLTVTAFHAQGPSLSPFLLKSQMGHEHGKNAMTEGICELSHKKGNGDEMCMMDL